MIQPEATRDAALQSARQERLGGDGNPWSFPTKSSRNDGFCLDL
jgi:hypothetical protein